MTTKQTDLERVFIDAICTETAPACTPIECSCGRTHGIHDGLKFGMFMGATVVVGCTGQDDTECPVAIRFGNLAWEYRHQFARFVRAMSDVMVKDRNRLLGTLPKDVGIRKTLDIAGSAPK